MKERVKVQNFHNLSSKNFTTTIKFNNNTYFLNIESRLFTDIYTCYDSSNVIMSQTKINLYTKKFFIPFPRDNFTKAMMEEDMMVNGRIITLCGSTKYKEVFKAIRYLLENQYYIVLTVESFMHREYDPKMVDTIINAKPELDSLHKDKISYSHSIAILNVDGYIGQSTASEIHYARSQGKKIAAMMVIGSIKNQETINLSNFRLFL